MPVAEDDKKTEDKGRLASVVEHRSSRRQVLKGAALAGAGLVWAAPVVEALTVGTAAAASPAPSPSPPPSSTFPSWAYVIYTTAEDASGINVSNLYVAGYQLSNGEVIENFAANPHGGLSSPQETIFGSTVVMTIAGNREPGPVPVTVTVGNAAAITATPESSQTSVTQAGNTISPTQGVTILGAFYFSAGSVQFQPATNGSVTLTVTSP